MWLYPLETAGLITFTEQILQGKLHLFAVILTLLIVRIDQAVH